MGWNPAMQKMYNGATGALLFVLLVSPGFAAPNGKPFKLGNSQSNIESSASTVEVLRNIQKILSATKPIGIKPNKSVKQEESEGSANALAYLTDSFGGQLAGQILSVILSSVTGDVRGILGNSLNLFQTDERRDRVQFFLDELSQNFLKVTGLGLLTTPKPANGTAGSATLGGAGGTQAQLLKPQQAFPLGSFGGVGGASSFGGVGGASSFGGVGGASSFGGVGGASSVGNRYSSATGGAFTGSIGNNIGGASQQRPQQTGAAGNQPIIYVLPTLNQNQGSSTASKPATTAAKVTSTTGNKATSATTGGGDDDSEEDIGRSLD